MTAAAAKSPAASWVPRAGSLAHRVLQFLVANPDEELFAADISIKFDVETKAIKPCLVGALTAGAIVLRKDDAGRAAYTLGPDQSWRERLAPSAANDGDDGEVNAVARRGRNSGAVLSAADIRGLQIERCFPFPDRKQARAASIIAMQEKLRQLQPDDRVEIPEGARSICATAMKVVGLDTGAKLALKPSKGVMYCWRLA